MELDWKEVIRLYQEPLYWHIRRMVVSHEDAADLLQEVFMSAFRHSGQLRDRGAVKAWLYRIATNLCLRFLERMAREVPLEEVPEVLEEHLADPEEVNLEEVAGIRFQKALLRLSPQQKVVFSLRYYEEMEYGEMESVTGWKTDVLKSSYHQAKKRMKEFLLDQD